jgi:hypothetical protein
VPKLTHERRTEPRATMQFSAVVEWTRDDKVIRDSEPVRLCKRWTSHLSYGVIPPNPGALTRHCHFGLASTLPRQTKLVQS